MFYTSHKNNGPPASALSCPGSGGGCRLVCLRSCFVADDTLGEVDHGRGSHASHTKAGVGPKGGITALPLSPAQGTPYIT